ncbi:MAG TPA: fasciclin domain-containing protein [Balneolaceae bacterium]|nr:fasciclin domain-containing protein [Balneolaceae bacterium]
MKTLINNPTTKLKNLLRNGILLIAAIAVFNACKDDDNSTSATNEPGTIDEVAQSNDNFSTLVSALQDAGLITSLQGTGPFTVFAPTNDAFANLPNGLLASLTNEQLTEILSYHVISAEIASGDLQAEQTAGALAGGELFVTVDGGNVTVNGNSTVTDADIEASNGIIHAVNQVLLPDRYQDIVGIVAKRYALQTLEDAVVQAGLAGTLQQNTQDGYTVFAPANSAFEGIDLSSLSQQQLQDILTYHVLPAKVLSSDISAGTVTTVNGATLEISVGGDGTVTLTDQAGNTFTVTQADLEGTNGVVHIIDGVLMPS